MEKALGLRCQHQEGHAGAASALAEHGDAARITAKVLYVFLHPTQGLDLVENARITRHFVYVQIEKSCAMQSNGTSRLVATSRDHIE